VGFWSTHGLVCLFEISGHSARSGQTLAKKEIKAKKSAIVNAEHRVDSFQTQKIEKNTSLPFPCQAFFGKGVASRNGRRQMRCAVRPLMAMVMPAVPLF
jgi:hypothetical protein